MDKMPMSLIQNFPGNGFPQFDDYGYPIVVLGDHNRSYGDCDYDGHAINGHPGYEKEGVILFGLFWLMRIRDMVG